MLPPIFREYLMMTFIATVTLKMMDVVIVQGSNNTLDLSFLNETSTRYVVGEGLTIPAFSTFEVITPAQYDALK